ncbi:hypothetical protein [Flagellimonas pelagia]|uniref:Uncharacterized protein n=1 Tax=Flagellimonas pelagia TaxID=2306998 RepID=A0A3A1NJT1_9FLAO|nr:hypothetical protein [Allomuricauda maritima]RIV44486.1 hypothetical protein D2V05_08965 [Allomuricauda maritima]TXJ94549.1 hypothetical protein FQ017_08880 [Allomuricauda maritima]
MKKLNLLTMGLWTLGLFLMSCTKDYDSEPASGSGNIVTMGEAVEVKCWDLNKNGVADQEEDKNKDGKVDSNDCSQS